jgi:hypothetical protein
MKLILSSVFVILSFSQINAQTFSFGGIAGLNRLSFDNKSEYGVGISFLGTMTLNKTIAFDFRAGFTAASDYIGENIGGYFKFFPINESVYLITGIKLHFNMGESRTGSGTRDDIYRLPTFGIGFNLDKISIELLYEKPFPNGLSWSFVENQCHYTDDFNSILILNIGFSW